MCERFTDGARKIMQFANKEAIRLNHTYIGTEHILLGLTRVDSPVISELLGSYDLTPERIREEIEKILRTGPDTVSMDKLPQTPRSKKAIEYAIEEARNLHHNYVGEEHLLLGLLREEGGLGAIILTNLGLNLEETRKKTLEVLASGREELRGGLHLKTENSPNMLSEVLKVIAEESKPKEASLKEYSLHAYFQIYSDMARRNQSEIKMPYEREN